MYVLPPNVFVSFDPGLASLLLSLIPVRNKQVIDSVFNGTTRRSKITKLDKFISKKGLKSSIKYASLFQKSIVVNDKCIKCKKCIVECPVENLKMTDHGVQILNHCAFCLNCIYTCPKQAITTSKYGFIILKNGYSIDSYEKISPNQHVLPKGLLMSGIRKYITELTENP